MKKFAKITAVLLLVALTVTALVACGFSTTGDPDKDEKKLKKQGYEVEVYKYEEDEIDEDGLIAELYAMKYSKDIDDLENLDEKELEKIKFNYVDVYYYNSKDAAKAAYDEIKDEYKDVKDVKCKVKLSGKAVVVTISGKGSADL